jgi:Holliday junction resolvasome RuvABC endonuclease subunit
MMPFQTTVLGIDASARSTGIVLLSPDRITIEQVIKPGNLKEGERLAFIEEAVLKTLEGKKIDLAAMEGPSYRSINKPFTLGEVYGTFKLVLFKKKIPVIIVPPKTLKKYAVGVGTAKKELMMKAAQEQGCRTNQEDISDAWHLARLGQDVLEGSSLVRRRASEEVVQKMRKELCP